MNTTAMNTTAMNTTAMNTTQTKRTRVSRSTMSKRERRGRMEASRPVRQTHVFTNSEFPPLNKKIQETERELQTLSEVQCRYRNEPCWYESYGCTTYGTGLLERCQDCEQVERVSDKLSDAWDALWAVRDQYSLVPTFSAIEASSKGAKKDRTRWNHAPRVRLDRISVKKHKARAQASKSDI
jgi:hypothetical protein